MNSWKRPLRRVLGLVGYSLHRWPTNRFDDMQDALLLLRRSGYFPRIIIDAGANVGNWTRMARSVFHHGTIHLVEPHPACRGALCMGDVVFVRRDSALVADRSWA